MLVVGKSSFRLLLSQDEVYPRELYWGDFGVFFFSKLKITIVLPRVDNMFI